MLKITLLHRICRDSPHILGNNYWFVPHLLELVTLKNSNNMYAAYYLGLTKCIYKINFNSSSI